KKTSWIPNEPNRILDDALKEFRSVVGPQNGSGRVSDRIAAKPFSISRNAQMSVSAPTLLRQKKDAPGHAPSLQPRPETAPDAEIDPIKALESFESRRQQTDWPEPVSPVPTAPTLEPEETAEPEATEPPYHPSEETGRAPRSLRSYRRLVWTL